MATEAVDIPAWTHSRARIAALSRSRTADDPELLDARRDLHAARLAEHIERVVATAPKLTDAQVDRLTALFHDTPDTAV